MPDKLHEIDPRARAILFGSRARGTERKGSDWDVLIFLDKSRITLQDYDKYSYPLRELGWDIDESSTLCSSTEVLTDWVVEVAEHDKLDVIEALVNVYNSWIVPKIDNYNSSMYYENTSYQYASYKAGRAL